MCSIYPHFYLLKVWILKKSEQPGLLCQKASTESCKVMLCDDEIPVDKDVHARNSVHLKGEYCVSHGVGTALMHAVIIK